MCTAAVYSYFKQFILILFFVVVLVAAIGVAPIGTGGLAPPPRVFF